MSHSKLAVKLRQQVAGMTLPELEQFLEFGGWGYKLHSQPLLDGTRVYKAQVYGADDLRSGEKVAVVGNPVETLTEAYVSCCCHRVRQAKQLGVDYALTPTVFTLEQQNKYRKGMPPGATIEEQAINLLTPVLASCVRQRTALGIQKYGQRLDENHQESRAKAIHFIHEMLDGLQYALWDGDAPSARQCANLAIRKRHEYQLSPAEIMAGGKV